MDTQRKALALGKLGEPICWQANPTSMVWPELDDGPQHYTPYRDTPEGRAQFAALILENIQLLPQFEQEHDQCGRWWPFEPTQANLLDEILRKHGVDLDVPDLK